MLLEAALTFSVRENITQIEGRDGVLTADCDCRTALTAAGQ